MGANARRSGPRHARARSGWPVALARAAAVTAVVLGTSAGSAPERVALPAAARAVQPPRPVPEEAAVVDPVGLVRSAPVRVRIPAIGLDSRLMALGLAPDGSLEVPPTGFPAGWYTGGPTPGELGPAVLLGHVDWNGPAVFEDLHAVRRGALVTVTRADGSAPTFRVTRVARFPKDHFPTDLVYGNLDHAGLRLITCGGAVNAFTGHYEDNVVVFADLVEAPA